MIRDCPQCGNAFKVSISYASETRGLFCSRTCANTFRTRPAEARFWDKVDKLTTPDGCWPWIGARDHDGYGLFSATQEKQEMAHRVAYRLANGEFVAGLKVLHHCDNPPCCNPEHLFLGTVVDNNADMIAKGRHRPHGKMPKPPTPIETRPAIKSRAVVVDGHLTVVDDMNADTP